MGASSKAGMKPRASFADRGYNGQISRLSPLGVGNVVGALEKENAAEAKRPG